MVYAFRDDSLLHISYTNDCSPLSNSITPGPQETPSIEVGPIGLSTCDCSIHIILHQAYPSLCPQSPSPPASPSQVCSSVVQPTSPVHVPSAIHLAHTPHILLVSLLHWAQVVVNSPPVLCPRYNYLLHNTPTLPQLEGNASSWNNCIQVHWMTETTSLLVHCSVDVCSISWTSAFEPICPSVHIQTPLPLQLSPLLLLYCLVIQSTCCHTWALI